MYINDFPANLKILNDVVVNVVTKNAENIPSNYRFANLKFNHKEEYVIEIPIKNQTEIIDIVVNGSISF